MRHMNTKTLLTVAAAALLLRLAACQHRQGAPAPAGPLAVAVARPTVDSLTIFRTYPATVGARASAEIVARVDGTLLTRNYQAGALVERGQVLFTLDPTTYRDAADQARAALATAKSEYAYASSQADAMRRALLSDAVSKLEVIQAETAMEQAAQAIKQAEAQLDLALTNLSYCTVRAPFRGHITSSTVDPGAYVAGAAAPFTLATLYDDGEVTATFSIAAPQYQQMAGGRSLPDMAQYSMVPVTFDGQVAHGYVGEIFYTSPNVDDATGTITLKCRIDNPYGELRAGMYATVHMPFATDSRALLVRDSAIATDQLGKYLYLVDDSNRVVYTPIEVGELYGDTLRIVSKGIAADSRYVTSAMLKVHDGMTVAPYEQ